jgi:hypothetical protein
MPTKPYWKSKTFWSDVITLIVAGLGISDQYAGTHIMSSSIASSVLAIAGLLGIYGRASADTKLSNVI